MQDSFHLRRAPPRAVPSRAQFTGYLDFQLANCGLIFLVETATEAIRRQIVAEFGVEKERPRARLQADPKPDNGRCG